MKDKNHESKALELLRLETALAKRQERLAKARKMSFDEGLKIATIVFGFVGLLAMLAMYLYALMMRAS